MVAKVLQREANLKEVNSSKCLESKILIHYFAISNEDISVLQNEFQPLGISTL